MNVLEHIAFIAIVCVLSLIVIIGDGIHQSLVCQFSVQTVRFQFFGLLKSQKSL